MASCCRRCRACKANCDQYGGEFIWSVGSTEYSCRVPVSWLRRLCQQGELAPHRQLPGPCPAQPSCGSARRAAASSRLTAAPPSAALPRAPLPQAYASQLCGRILYSNSSNQWAEDSSTFAPGAGCFVPLSFSSFK
jgi:hypothetical protein